MELALEQLMPLPLRERVESGRSEIWLRSVHLHQGEKISIQAPSGTGKTTLAHILYGLRDDYIGSVLWAGKSMKETSSTAVADLRSGPVSIIFQDLRLFPELTAHENLELKRVLTNTISEEEVTSWMERLGIGDKKNSLGRTLSYGERQRVAIIRALLQPFQWLIMDEPFSHLDKANIEKASSLIEEVVNRNMQESSSLIWMRIIISPTQKRSGCEDQTIHHAEKAFVARCFAFEAESCLGRLVCWCYIVISGCADLVEFQRNTPG